MNTIEDYIIVENKYYPARGSCSDSHGGLQD